MNAKKLHRVYFRAAQPTVESMTRARLGMPPETDEYIDAVFDVRPEVAAGFEALAAAFAAERAAARSIECCACEEKPFKGWRCTTQHDGEPRWICPACRRVG